MHESFLRYRRFFYLYVALALVVLSGVVYILHQPIGRPGGDTWLGYTLGTLAALLIVWLMLLGARRRAYHSNLGTVRGWLSAHVYLGVALVVIATLHAGFQLGWNIHSLAWLLMVIVVLSGLFGVWVYSRYPTLISRNRDNLTRAVMLKEISELDRKSELLVEALGSPADRLVVSANKGFAVGGGLLNQLLGRDTSRMQAPVKPGDYSRWKLVGNPDQTVLLAALNWQLSRSTDAREHPLLKQLIDTIAEKRALARRLRADIRMQSLTEAWLYLHVPLSFALLAALIAHILSVFIYW